MKRRMISVSGLDGAGKTSIIQEVMKISSASNVPIKYFWCSYQLILLKPIVRPLQMFFLRKENQFKDYNKYKKTIDKLSGNTILAKTYASLTQLEYLLQVYMKICFSQIFSKNLIICDRYYYDVFVSLALTLSYNDDELIRKINNFSKLCPKPDVAYYVDIKEDVAYNRKNDIPSIQYLKQRRRLYLLLAQKYDMKILNGECDPNDNATRIMSNLFVRGVV